MNENQKLIVGVVTTVVASAFVVYKYVRVNRSDRALEAHIDEALALANKHSN